MTPHGMYMTLDNWNFYRVEKYGQTCSTAANFTCFAMKSRDGRCCGGLLPDILWRRISCSTSIAILLSADS
jgi:hypothetical protein